jgi:hypothetical protein
MVSILKEASLFRAGSTGNRSRVTHRPFDDVVETAMAVRALRVVKSLHFSTWRVHEEVLVSRRLLYNRLTSLQLR